MGNFLREKYNKLKRPLILDGAIGSLLIAHGIKADKFLWSSIANLTAPNIVKQVHLDYIKAGTDIITTNTFRTNPAAVKLSGYDINSEDFVAKSVHLATDLKKEYDIFVAGSNAPAEDCYQAERTLGYREIEYNHKKHIELLYENGCDFILNETQSHLDEIEITSKFCSENKIPFVVSLYFDNNLNLLSGESLSEAVHLILSYSPIAISSNCVPPKNFETFIKNYSPDFEWGFYLNCGIGEPADEAITCSLSPEEYLNDLKKWLPMNPLFVGACCGSNPNHIKVIKEYLDGKNNN